MIYALLVNQSNEIRTYFFLPNEVYNQLLSQDQCINIQIYRENQGINGCLTDKMHLISTRARSSAPQFFPATSHYLHFLTNRFTIRQDLGHLLAAENISQRCLGYKVGGAGSILNVYDGHGGVVNAEEDNGIHFHCNTVLGENLQSHQ